MSSRAFVGTGEITTTGFDTELARDDRSERTLLEDGVLLEGTGSQAEARCHSSGLVAA